MARARLTVPDILTTALNLVDDGGLKAISLSAVAADLSVGPSALYAHVDGLDGLHYLVAVASTRNLTGRVRDAAIGTAGDSALGAMGAAYRGFALDHPGQFASTLVPPRNEADDLALAGQELVDVFGLVYRNMGLDPTRSQLAARSTRSAIHGFLALETATGTTPSHESDFLHLLETLRLGNAAQSDSAASQAVRIDQPEVP